MAGGGTVKVVSRRLDLDAVRALSAIGVVAVHASAGTVLKGPSAVDANTYGVALLFDAAGRVAVPLFFAIAGWVLLVGKPVANGRDLAARVRRVLVALLVWTLVYVLWTPVWEKTYAYEDTWEGVARALLGEPAAGHLWYLYAYVPLVLAFGTVTLLLRREPPWWAVAALVIIGTAPVWVLAVSRLTGAKLATTQWDLPMYAIGFAAAGAAVFGFLPGLPGRWRQVAAVVLLGFTLVMTVVAWMYGYTMVFAYASPFVAVQFAFAAAAFNHALIPRRLERAVRSLAEASFGVYLVHMLVLQALLLLLGFVSPRVGGIDGYVAIPLVTGMTVAVSWALSVAWGKAGLRRWLG